MISLANKDDKFHKEGLDIFEEFIDKKDCRYLFTDYIVDEFLTFVSRKGGMKLSIIWGDYLFEEKWFDLIYTPPSVVNEAWNIFQKEINQRNTLSFTDCTIVSYCILMKINEIITFDTRLKSYL